VDDRQTELQALYERTRTRVQRVLNEADPEGLLAMGAPNDEYDDAVGEFTRRLINGETLDRASIESWFLGQFGSVPSAALLLEATLTAISESLSAE
jgi:hypothetical protein